jgi:Zn-dependent protease
MNFLISIIMILVGGFIIYLLGTYMDNMGFFNLMNKGCLVSLFVGIGLLIGVVVAIVGITGIFGGTDWLYIFGDAKNHSLR